MKLRKRINDMNYKNCDTLILLIKYVYMYCILYKNQSYLLLQLMTLFDSLPLKIMLEIFWR